MTEGMEKFRAGEEKGECNSWLSSEIRERPFAKKGNNETANRKVVRVSSRADRPERRHLMRS